MDKKEEIVDTNIAAEKSETSKEQSEELNAQYKQFQDTKESFNKLPADQQIQVTEENKKNIPEETIKTAEEKIQAIKKNNPEADIQLDDYLSFYLTAQQENVKDTKFTKDFEKLNAMWFEEIPLSETNNPKTTDKLINSNDSLRNYASDSDALKDIAVPLSEEIKYDDEEFDTYVKFIEDDEIRKDIKKNQKEIQDFHQKKQENTEENPDDEAIKNIYQQYTAEIAKIKNNIKENTTDMLQKRILGSCIS